MPLPGGTSDKLGNRFEGRWTALAILEVLREEASSIRLEPPGSEGEGVEFYVRYSDRTTYHQVKRQRAGGDWTIAALRGAGVLQSFLARLADPTAHCTFVSAHSASSLEDLTDKARNAVSWSEYERAFVISKPQKGELAALQAAFGNPGEVALLDMLRRIHVETIGEERLRRYATLQAEMVLQGDQSVALPTLVDVALNNVNRYLTADEIWKQLESYNFRPSMWTLPAQAAVHVNDANAKYIESRRATLIRGELIPRLETQRLVEALASKRLVLLDGVAGTGKSDVVLQFVEDLAERNVPHLVLRLDQATPTRRPDELGRDFGLPGSPAAVLAAVAQGREAVLVIDQLDAVSATSGRNPQFLDCVSDVVRSAQSSSNLRIVLVCRTFDIHNDARLRQLVERDKDFQTVTVGPLPQAAVKEVASKIGYGPRPLRDAQVELLRTPLHLALFVGAVTAGAGQFDFETSLDLHNEFWRRKRQELDQRLGGGSWVPVVERLVDFMSRHQVLRAPAAIVDQWEPYVEAMVSANVLTRDGQQLAFFHETFFDYAFARTFIAKQGSIESLLSQDQFLFRRAQVRQILAHERLSPGPAFRRDLAYLIQEPSVRFHLKDLVVSWLSQVAPTSSEWGLVEPLLLDESSALFGRAWRLLVSEDWFNYADAVGFIARHLEAEDKLTESTVSIVAAAASRAPQRVAELVCPFSSSAKWFTRIGRVVSQADLGTSRDLFDLCLHWVYQFGATIEPQTLAEFDHAARELAQRNPEWGCELIANFVRRRVAFARELGFDNPFDHASPAFPSGVHLELVVDGLAKAAPVAYVEHVWPVIFEVIERTSRRYRRDGLQTDPVWAHRHLGVPSLEDSLLTGVEVAFAHAAKTHPDVFERLFSEQKATEHETVLYLLYQGFAAQPERYADAAIDFLLADVRRLRVRYSNGEHWGTRRLLESLTPYASQASLDALEHLLLGYDPDLRWGRSGWVQFELLGGIAKARRSQSVNKRLAELQRKFDSEDAPPPQGIVMGTVASPIEVDAASKMNDEQWRRAIAKYSTRELDHVRDFLKGGAEELAHVLQEETKKEPERFARLGLSLTDDTHDAYFDALLRGVAETKQTPTLEVTEKLVERCHELPGRPCGRSIAAPLVKHGASNISDHALDIVSWYALNDPDPEPENGGDDHLDLTTIGLNCVRGSVASAIAELVNAKSERFAPMKAAIEALCTDPVPAVRAMAAQIACCRVVQAPEEAQALFLQIVAAPDDRVLATHFVHLYLLWQAADDFAVLRPVLERMVASNFAPVRESGAAHLNLVALNREDARDVADACATSDDIAQRLGAARVFAANLRTKAYSQRCTAGLKIAFNDVSPKIRAEAGSVFWRMQGAELGEHVALATAYLESAAFETNADDLVHALRETTAAVPELILATCKRALDAFELNRHGPLAHQANESLGLVLRAFADSTEPAEKNRALDFVDRALRLDIYGPHKMLAEHDRWWDKS